MKNKKILISIIVIIVLVFGIFGVLFVKGSSYNIVKKQYNELTKIIDSSFKECKVQIKNNQERLSMQGDIKLKLNLNFNSNNLSEEGLKAFNSIQDEINKLTISYNIGSDLKNEYMGYNIKLLKSGNEIAEADMNIKEDMAYLKLKDTLEDYIKIDLGQNMFDLVENSEGINVDDYEKLYNVVKREIEKNILKKNNIESEKVIMTVNGMEKKLKKNTVEIDKITLLNFEKSVLTTIKNDNDLVSCLTNILKGQNENQTNDMTIEYLDNSIKSIQEELDKSTVEEAINIQLIIYTEGLLNVPVQYEIKQNNNNILRVVIEEFKGDSIALKGFIADQSGNINTANYLRIEYMKNKENPSLNLLFKNSNLGSISFEVTSKIIKDATITIPDFSKSKNISDLGLDEFGKFQDKLLQVIEKIIPADTINSSGFDELSKIFLGGNNKEETDVTEYNFAVDEDVAEEYNLDNNNISID